MEVEAKQLVEDVLLKWPLMEKEAKLSEYLKSACHELHFFLAVRDKPFFEEVALPLINGKLEKTFIDWYLLSKTHDSYLQKVLSLVVDESIHKRLNFFEMCLLIETCIKRGNEA